MVAVIGGGAFAGARTTEALPLPIPDDGPPATKYALIDIGPLGDMQPPAPATAPNADSQGTMGINNHGEVVYGYEVNGVVHGFVWLPNANYGLTCGSNGGRHDLNTLSGVAASVTTIARDINDAGQIVGQTLGTNVSGTTGEAVIWELASGSATMTTLGKIDATRWSAAHAINDDADPMIVGNAGVFDDCCSSNMADLVVGFKRRLSDSGLTRLSPGTTAFGTLSEARDVNTVTAADPDLIGRSFCSFFGPAEAPTSAGCFATGCSQFTDANAWPAAVTTSQLLPELSVNEYSARGVNNARNVVGFGREGTAQCLRRALYWEEPDNMSAFDVLGNFMPSGDEGDQSRAEAVNDMCLPQVVGWNVDQIVGVRWDRQHNLTDWEAIDLSDAIRSCDGDWVIREAHDINDDGWIACWGHPAGEPGNRHALVLIPVPHVPGDDDGDEMVGQLDLLSVTGNWGGTCSGCPYCPGDVTGDGLVDLDDLLLVIGNWGSVLDPCAFVPDIECFGEGGQTLLAGGGGGFGSSMMSGSSSTQTPFADVLEEYGFENWDEAAAWMSEASPAEVAEFLAALTDGED